MELEDAYIQPEGMLGFNGDQKPWDLRDRFRQLAVDLNPMFVMREDSEQTFEQVRKGKDGHSNESMLIVFVAPYFPWLCVLSSCR